MKSALALLSCAILFTSASSASAQASVTPSLEPLTIGQRRGSFRKQGWEYNFETYLWAVGVDGKTRLGAQGPHKVDTGFSDAFSDGNYGGMLSFEIGPRARPWSILIDSLYLDVAADKRGVEFGYDQGFLEGMFAWEVPYQPESQLLAGVRAWMLEPRIQQPGRRPIEVEEEWLDPVFGFRWAAPGSSEYDLFMRADVGGFGIGSELTWQASGGIRWNLGTNSTFDLGWRHMALEYDEGGVDLDLTFSGPLIGFTFGL